MVVRYSLPPCRLDPNVRVEADEDGRHEAIEAVEDGKDDRERRDADGNPDDRNPGDDCHQPGRARGKKVSFRYEGAVSHVSRT